MEITIKLYFLDNHVLEADDPLKNAKRIKQSKIKTLDLLAMIISEDNITLQSPN